MFANFVWRFGVNLLVSAGTFVVTIFILFRHFDHLDEENAGWIILIVQALVAAIVGSII